MTTYYLSWPPSTNSLWRAINGRNILSRRARSWVDVATSELIEQKAKQIHGEVEITIELCSPFNRPFDLDNRIKAVLDILTKNGVIDDDDCNVVKRLVVAVGDNFKGAKVSIRPL